MPSGPGSVSITFWLVKVIAHVAETPCGLEPVFRVVTDDAACFLSTVLECMQAKRHEIRRIGRTDHPEDPAFFFELVAIVAVAQVACVKRVGGRHNFGQRGSSESVAVGHYLGCVAGSVTQRCTL